MAVARPTQLILPIICFTVRLKIPESGFCIARASIDYLRAAGIATVTTSGQQLHRFYQRSSCISTAISVVATTKADAVASHSNSAFRRERCARGLDSVMQARNKEICGLVGLCAQGCVADQGAVVINEVRDVVVLPISIPITQPSVDISTP